MQITDYAAKMGPYARQAAAGTGLPVDLILAQWAHETGWGESALARDHNNHGGINWTENADYNADGRHAGYRTIDSFVRDYIRVINLSYYAPLREAAAAGSPISGLVNLFGPYAEDPQYAGKVLTRVGQLESVGGIPERMVSVAIPPGLNLPDGKVQQFASAGLVLVAALAGLWALMKE